MLTVRSRDGYKYFLMKHGRRQDVLEWKKGKRDFPEELYESAKGILCRYFSGFDVVTVPAPSFHTYKDYPIWEMARRLQKDCGFDLKKLFPRPSGKTLKHFTAWRQKEIQNIVLRPGKFVLVLDDIATTGNTMKITYEAILRKGAFPCGMALA